MLDRGQSQDWFSSTEIWIETGVAVIALWMFCVHMATAKKPLFSLSLFAGPQLRDRRDLHVHHRHDHAGGTRHPAVADRRAVRYSVTDTGIILAARGVGVLPR